MNNFQFDPQFVGVAKGQQLLTSQLGLNPTKAFQVVYQLWTKGFIRYSIPNTCVDGIAFCGNQILLIKRPEGTYATPGGFVEAFDPELEAYLKMCSDWGFTLVGQKEIMEEANQDFMPATIIGESSRPGRDLRLPSVPTILIGGTVTNPDAVRYGDDAVGAGWYDFLQNGDLNQGLLDLKMHADHRLTLQKIFNWWNKHRNMSDKTVADTLKRMAHLPYVDKEVVRRLAEKREPKKTYIQDAAEKFLARIVDEKLAGKIVDLLVEGKIISRWGQYPTAVDAIIIKGNQLLTQTSQIDDRKGKRILPGTFLRVAEKPESFDQAIARCLEQKLGVQVETVGPIVRVASGVKGDPRTWRNCVAKVVFLTDQKLQEPKVNSEWVKIDQASRKKDFGYDHNHVIADFVNWLKANGWGSNRSAEQIVRHNLYN